MNATRTCSMAGCDRTERLVRGVCRPHYSSLNRRGQAKSLPPMRTIPGECSVAGCDVRGNRRGLCKLHYERFMRTGDPLGIRPGRWQDHVGSYTSVHKRIRLERGNASEHRCVDCQGQAAEWSYRGGAPDERSGLVRGSVLAFSSDIDYYDPRCVRCHRIFDIGARKP